MIYTEYFVRGTQPDTECPLHRGASFTERLAGIFGRDSGTPVSADAIGLPPASASTSGAPAASTASSPSSTATSVEAEKPEEPRKRRGFWSRIFGRGGDDDDRKKREEEERKKKEEERKRQDERKRDEERRRKGG